ncbi:hypothetical protein MTX26_01795 [Bradyrhizobium sp. ISRA443]|uniref:hypothetical protein n=1 Tax=unclassified Bradyrhizobium TaxID=2631580 RepID=UPI002479FB8F|nr:MULTISPECIES: hypothetical protein [unclassified Bradyrhizobium]WGR94801.1 hypothetical protein MTX20_11825 [Bradyrhizobium sp. ISRA435]WGR99632.1 hypothetical protein MTX23_01795 [Bradyrhizobium sp. ISRA436]WGS06522.1 hypothetical protein MTX18_01795 [Bradyrhizobium sp. ISRA437]WGS13406.1 hypothetical protein MTX26_01795 [Bradyrhizobium sp. ISRA443]
MPAAEITAAITSIRAAYDFTKGMVAVRDSDLLAKQARELNAMMLDVLDKSIAARQSYIEQTDELQALKAELAASKNWDRERERYELKSVGSGAMVYMLKPEARASEPPYWLCPNCFAQGKKSFPQSTHQMHLRQLIYNCVECKGTFSANKDPNKWLDGDAGDHE